MSIFINLVRAATRNDVNKLNAQRPKEKKNQPKLWKVRDKRNCRNCIEPQSKYLRDEKTKKKKKNGHETHTHTHTKMFTLEIKVNAKCQMLLFQNSNGSNRQVDLANEFFFSLFCFSLVFLSRRWSHPCLNCCCFLNRDRFSRITWLWCAQNAVDVVQKITNIFSSIFECKLTCQWCVLN